MTHSPIPQTDPRAGYIEQQSEIHRAIARVLAGGQYILGSEVGAFEAAFAGWLGASHAVGVGSGTDAIELALRACGIGQNPNSPDLVLTVSHTAVATVAAIERAGAFPVLVDIEPGGFRMDPAAL
jgi:dTDP-4-amino-4,6-dideoxygalactose transaminase